MRSAPGRRRGRAAGRLRRVRRRRRDEHHGDRGGGARPPVRLDAVAAGRAQRPAAVAGEQRAAPAAPAGDRPGSPHRGGSGRAHPPAPRHLRRGQAGDGPREHRDRSVGQVHHGAAHPRHQRDPPRRVADRELLQPRPVLRRLGAAPGPQVHRRPLRDRREAPGGMGQRQAPRRRPDADRPRRAPGHRARLRHAGPGPRAGARDARLRGRRGSRSRRSRARRGAL